MKKQFAIIKILIGLLVITAGNLLVAAQQSPDQKDMTIDAAVRDQVVKGLIKNLNQSYIFLETAKKMEADLLARSKNKEYDSMTSAAAFAKKLTTDLQAISKDKHLRVGFSFDVLPARNDAREPSKEEIAAQLQFMRRVNFGFEKVERMQGNIGYIDLRGFTDPETGAETVAAAMTFVANTDAIIFDLRQNGGGDPAMVALICSYLFGEKPVHLNDLYFREENKTEEFWTRPDSVAKRFPDKDVFVLTSNRTFSGGEEFTYNLKNLKRATIIGETTGGGANPGGRVRLNDHFQVFVPTGRAISPITKTNWEGTGVEPDVSVPKEQALLVAYLAALNKSVERSTDENYKGSLKRLIERTQSELNELKKSAKQ